MNRGMNLERIELAFYFELLGNVHEPKAVIKLY